MYIGSAGCATTVFTDHNPFVWIELKNENRKLLNWYLILQKYNIIIKHIAGKDNVRAGTLSRILLLKIANIS